MKFDKWLEENKEYYADFSPSELREQFDVEQEAYEYGYNRGWQAVEYGLLDQIDSIIEQTLESDHYWDDIDTILEDLDEFIDDVLKTKAYEMEEGGRQFSPFEFHASDFNKSPDPEATWDAYGNGVAAGVQDAIKENEKELKEMIREIIG